MADHGQPDETGASREDLAGLRSILDDPSLGPMQDWALDEALSLAEFAEAAGAPPDQTRGIIRRYLADPSPRSFEAGMRRIFRVAHDLPGEFDEIESTGMDELLAFAEAARGMGDENFDIFRDPGNLQALRDGGVRGAERGILGPLIGRRFGVPPWVTNHQPVDKVLLGAEIAARIGQPDLVLDRDFWDGLDRLTAQDIEQLRKAKADRGPSAGTSQVPSFAESDVHQQREQVRESRNRIERRLTEDPGTRRKKRLRRTGRVGKKRRKKRQFTFPAPVLDPQLPYVERRVRTVHGNNYLLRAYEDDSTELFRIERGELHLVLKRAHFAWEVVPGAGRQPPLVTPIFGSVRSGRRRASPLDLTSQQRGPQGLGR